MVPCDPRTRRANIYVSIDIHNERFKALTGTDAEPDTMERDIDQSLMWVNSAPYVAPLTYTCTRTRSKDKEVARLESFASIASREMHSAESALTSYRDQIRKKETELKSEWVKYYLASMSLTIHFSTGTAPEIWISRLRTLHSWSGDQGGPSRTRQLARVSVYAARRLVPIVIRDAAEK